MTVGADLQYVRESYGLTRNDLSLTTGLPVRTVSMVEGDAYPASEQVLTRILRSMLTASNPSIRKPTADTRGPIWIPIHNTGDLTMSNTLSIATGKADDATTYALNLGKAAAAVGITLTTPNDPMVGELLAKCALKGVDVASLLDSARKPTHQAV